MIRIIVVVIALCAPTNTKAYAQVDGHSNDQPPFTQTRYALAINGGQSYSPTNEIQFAQGAAIALFDYDKVWPHSAPEPLRFKVEAAVGMASTPHGRALMSVNMLALYFIEPLATSTLRPYIEAGIGVSYSDYLVEDQGSRFNFNPQLGIGSEITSNGGPPWFIACRLHHISNGGLDDDNRGINSALIQIGRFF
jgi:hypothetical protein